MPMHLYHDIIHDYKSWQGNRLSMHSQNQKHVFMVESAHHLILQRLFFTLHIVHNEVKSGFQCNPLSYNGNTTPQSL